MKLAGPRSLLLLLCLATAAKTQSLSGDFLRVTHPEPLPGALAAALDDLDTTRLTRHMAFLSHQQQEGRGLGSRGLERTVRYLTDQLEAMGIEPLGPSYRHAVSLRKVVPKNSSLRLRLGSSTFTFQAGRDAVLPPMAPGTLAGPLVFAGHGIQEPALGHDDFKGLDVRGRFILFLDGLPSGEAWRKPDLIEKYASERRADRYDSRLALFEKLGARGAIALEEGLEQRIAAGKEPTQAYFLGASEVPISGEPPLARVALTPALLLRIKAGLEDTATLMIQGKVKALRGFNVLGKVEGSDPALRKEAILVGAHMDHLGSPGGILHPGADDNASGVAALLELTRAIAISPTRPRRSLLIAFWTGEEDGKFGSGHYTRHPRWPLASTKAYLNLDMIGHPWTTAEVRTLTEDADLEEAKPFLAGLDPAWFAEPGLASNHPELGPILLRAGRATSMSLHLDWTDGRNGGSDYRDFARLGLPFVRFFGSYFPAYHQPGDTLDRLDPEQVKRMARLVLATAWLLADR